MGRNLTGGSAVAAPSSGSSSSSSSSSSSGDTRKEGLPCIATWSMNDDNARRFDCVIYDSTGSQIGSPWGYGTNSSPGDYYGGLVADKYWGVNGDNGNPFRTNGTLASNSSNYKIKATTWASHHPQHAMMNVSPQGSFHSNRWTSNGGVYEVHRNMVTQVLPEGVRPRCALTRNGEWLYRSRALNMTQQGSAGGDKISLWEDTDLEAKFGGGAGGTISPRSIEGSMNKGFGACGYNEATGEFIVLWRWNGSTASRITRWKLTKSLNDFNYTLKEIFLSAASVEMTSSNFALGWGGSSEAYRWMITVGDNGWIRMSNFKESDDFTTFLVDPTTLALASASHQSNGDNRFSNTTSYGMEQSWMHLGCTYNSTWDNKWHVHYCHYYYYGSGIQTYIISTEDPRVVYRWSYSETNDGNSPHAWGKTGFIFNKSSNSDSNDHTMFNLDLAGMKRTTEAIAAMPSTIAEGAGTYYGYQRTIQPTTMFADLNLTDQSYWFPAHGWSSTNYPCLLNVNWWPTKDGIMQYPGDY